MQLSTLIVARAKQWLWEKRYYDTRSIALHCDCETLHWVEAFYPGGLIGFLLQMED